MALLSSYPIPSPAMGPPPPSPSHSPALPPPAPPPHGPTPSLNKTKPTVVFVPGAWHTSAVWKSVISMLTTCGYPCTTIDLPSVGGLVASMQEDTDEIYELLERLVGSGKEVILVMHSYGGLPGSVAVKGLGKVEGRKGGVVHMLFLGSFVLNTGEAALDLLKGELPPWAEPDPVDKNFLLCNCPEKVWYQDLPPGEASYWASLLKPQCTITFIDKVTHPGWQHIPSTYLITQQDLAVPAFIQEQMLRRAPQVNVERCESGHAVMLSQPGVVCRLVRKVAGEEGC